MDKNNIDYNIFVLPSLIYALITSICVYKNFNGITLPFAIIGTIIYTTYYMIKTNTEIKIGTRIMMGFMFIISISSIFTNYTPIVIANIAVIFLLIIIMIIHSYVNDKDFNILNYLSAIIITILDPLFSIGNLSNYKCENATIKTNQNHESCMKQMFIGIIISIFILIVIIPLLISSDIIFKNIIMNIFYFDIKNIIGFCLFTVFIYFASSIGMKYINIHCDDNYIYRNEKSTKTITIITILSSISIVYVLYSAIQIFGLFMNKLSIPEDYTYAEYAREGFFQLLFVAFINLILIVLILNKTTNNKIIKILLTIVSVCTLIIIASSTYRMILYVKHYDLSHLRFFVFFALALIAFILIEAMINIYIENFNFSKYSLYTFLILYTILCYSKPCRIISKYNFTHKCINSIDFYYIKKYSTDAVDIIYEFYKENETELKDKYLNYDIEAYYSKNIEMTSDYVIDGGKNIKNVMKFNFSKGRFYDYVYR